MPQASNQKPLAGRQQQWTNIDWHLATSSRYHAHTNPHMHKVLQRVDRKPDNRRWPITTVNQHGPTTRHVSLIPSHAHSNLHTHEVLATAQNNVHTHEVLRIQNLPISGDPQQQLTSMDRHLAHLLDTSLCTQQSRHVQCAKESKSKAGQCWPLLTDTLGCADGTHWDSSKGVCTTLNLYVSGSELTILNRTL